MKAVILAAGEGKRMRPLTYTRPKVMLPIANKPILEHLLVETARAGITEFIFIVGYHDEQVRDYFENGAKWGVSIDYSYQSKQRGTANALKLVERLVSGKFLMINGDVVVNHKDITQLIERNENVMSLARVRDSEDLGVVELSGDKVTHIYEKMEKLAPFMANAGLYLFTPLIFDAIARTPESPRGEYELTDSLQLMIDGGQKIGYYELGYWLNLSYPWDLLSANESLLADMEHQNLGEIEENVVIKNPVSVGKSTVIRSGCYIVGPVAIGQNCDIGPNCYLRPCTSIGDNCHIGQSVEIKNSLIMNNTNVGHLSYIGDSVLGEKVNLGAGTVSSNLRHDGSNHRSEFHGELIDTGRRKFGVVVGDGVHTGINTSFYPGRKLYPGTTTLPGQIVQKDLKA